MNTTTNEKPRAVAIKLDETAMKKVVGGTFVIKCPAAKVAGRSFMVL